MDRYKIFLHKSHETIWDSVNDVHYVLGCALATKLNALERELAAANAKIEKALEHHAARTPHHVALERIEAALRKSED